MKKHLLIFFIFFLSCKPTLVQESRGRYVEDISFDPKMDSPNFKLCHEDKFTLQYFNIGKGLEFEGEKRALDRAILNAYDPKEAKKESGLIRIRFIVNCKGEAGRFRLLGSDLDYQVKDFDKSITDQLLKICRDLEGWKVKRYQEREIDYYQYLIFKIVDGEIIKILP